MARRTRSVRRPNLSVGWVDRHTQTHDGSKISEGRATDRNRKPCRGGFRQYARRDSNPQPSDPWISKRCPQASTPVHSRPSRIAPNLAPRMVPASAGPRLGASLRADFVLRYCDVEIHRTARRHGIDRAGNLLEVIWLELANDAELVIHAMRLRVAFYDLLPTRHGEDTP